MRHAAVRSNRKPRCADTQHLLHRRAKPTEKPWGSTSVNLPTSERFSSIAALFGHTRACTCSLEHPSSTTNQGSRERCMHGRQVVTDVLRSHGGVAPLAGPALTDGSCTPDQSPDWRNHRHLPRARSRGHPSSALLGRPGARLCSLDTAEGPWGARDDAHAFRMRPMSGARADFRSGCASALLRGHAGAQTRNSSLWRHGNRGQGGHGIRRAVVRSATQE